MKYFVTIGLFILISLSSSAQNKMLTMQDALVNNRSTLAPANLRGLQFFGNDYIYLKKINGTDEWVRGSFSKNEETFLTLNQLNVLLRTNALDTLKSLPLLRFTDSTNLALSLKGGRYQYNSVSKNIRLLQDAAYTGLQNVDESKTGNIAYLQNENLFIGPPGNAKQITTDGSAGIVYASSVHQSEFGITKGTFWSNSGNVLAFYRMDQTMIPDYPIIDWSTIPAKNINIKYPMAGDSSHHVTVGIYNTQNNALVYLQTGLPAEQYVTNIAWSPNDEYVYIAVVNREQNHMWLKQYNATTGAYVKTLFEEQDDKYTEPLVPMLFVPGAPDQFIWQSRRDGWNHLYLYSTNGQMIKQLTAGTWEVVEVKGFSADSKTIFYTGTKESPLAKNLYAVTLNNARSKRLTLGEGTHTTSVSSDGKFIIDQISSVTTPRQINLIETKSGKVKSLFSAPDPLAGYALGNMRLFSIKSNTNDDLYCRMFTPANFDSTKKYPVIVYWYGGPHAQMITAGYNGGAGDYWFQYLAERGYLVFSLDTRGSAYRGKAFEQSIFRQAGEMQMQDLENGVKYLASLPYADTSKMGLFGWSYGGFMTTDFVLNHPGVFKAAVAGGPVMDWREYEIMYGERYMDRPQENTEGYAKANLIAHAGKLKDKLLLIHGLQDPVVVQQHSVRFVKACIDANVQVDYMIYPGYEHNVIGKDRAHLYQKVTDYFTQYLK